MSLPAKWRLQIKNETGVSVDVTVNFRGRRIASADLQPEYGTWGEILALTTVANGAVANTATQDNVTDGWLTGEAEVELTNFSATPDGQVIVFFQSEGDAAGDFPADEEGFVLAAQGFTTTGAKVMTIPCV